MIKMTAVLAGWLAPRDDTVPSERRGDRLFRSLKYKSIAILLGLLLVSNTASGAQSAGPAASTSRASKVSLAEVVRNLPEYINPGTGLNTSKAFENATDEERDAALSGLMGWLNDDRPRVRGLALLWLNFLYMPTGQSRVITCNRYLPVEDVPVVATHLRDPDSRVRNATFLALGSVETCGHGLDQLVDLVVPMLREPDILTEYPDPFFAESNQQMLAHMTPQQQGEFKALPRPAIKLPAEGPVLLSILAVPNRTPSTEVDDAIIAFLNRSDQTKSTLGECLHTLALSRASERINDETLRRVFEHKAMTVYLLQFVTWLRLTPPQLAIQKERLVALSADASERPALRHAAATVSACWNGDRTSGCRPSSDEFREESITNQSKER